MTSRFRIGQDDFLLDGQPHRILSGAVHYFRVHPEQWADRIRKARLMGLNTIETYVAWNAHEPRRGEWDATGWNDLGAFLDLIAAEGMHAIVRPGPYICAEWHNGGLPVWLTGSEGIGLRRSEPQYLDAVSDYLRRVYEIVEPRQIDRGGPVVLVQIENEYGAYGADKTYLRHLVSVTRDAGIEVPLTTIDQPTDRMLSDGSLPELHKTGSFGSRAGERLQTLRRHQPTGPLMCAEFWDGWFDWWGTVHHTTAPADSAAELDALLAAGASVNFYMFHGGTNYGLTNGANDKGRYLPIVTSYDYDAPLDEAGDPTEKFFAFRDVIAKYASVPKETVQASADAPTFEVALAPVAVPLPGPDETRYSEPPTFDGIGHLGALVAYEVDLGGRGGTLRFGEIRDQAWISVDGKRVGTLSRTRQERALRIPSGSRLRVFVEEQGRVNYDQRLGEPKGLIGAVTLDDVVLTGWSAAPVDLHELAAAAALAPVGDALDSPIVLYGTFELAVPGDLFLDSSSWGKGFALVNGFLLGRYWRSGPQRTLYVPAPVLRSGINELAVVELETGVDTIARFLPRPSLGPEEE
ncbi:glycoside hydrolase family 35 protein [Microbacterium suwonense]|uniref:Beta-galactosidase n=1 Tax=Microbacterium suwonense TaxID=683047 RepID=A0ABM8FVF2_9MICO|nr:beta-galactosidase family protein [Microbacterium suwonense]BDZ39497.1 beta-galactosidase [Microbacterium suwonense]